MLEENDSVMADRGFLIHEDVKKIGVTLNIPAFLNGREKLTKAEVKESQTIASVRIHVDWWGESNPANKKIKNTSW